MRRRLTRVTARLPGKALACVFLTLVTIISGPSGPPIGSGGHHTGPVGLFRPSASQVTAKAGVRGTSLVASSPGFVPVGTYPVAVAYDPYAGTIFVSNAGTHNVSVISTATQSVISTIQFSHDPVSASNNNPNGVVYDPFNSNVYVVNQSSNDLNVIAADFNTWTASIRVGSGPDAVAFDPDNGDLYVANGGSDNVSVISGSNDTVVTSIGMGGGSGSSPAGVVCDPMNHTVYVTNADGAVTIVNDSSNTIFRSISTGGQPEGAVFDPTNGHVFVTDLLNNRVDDINGSTIVGSVSVDGGPNGLGFDRLNGLLYVGTGSPFSGTVDILNASTDTLIGRVPVGNAADGVAIDESRGLVYVADELSGNVAVLPTQPINVTRFVATPANFTLGHSTNLSATFDGGINPFKLYYMGLPAGCLSSVTTSLLCVPSASGNFTIVFNVDDWAGNSASAVVTLRVLPIPTYPVLFVETGLPAGTNWSTTLSGLTQSSTTSTIQFEEQNGSGYRFLIANVSGYDSTPSNGSLAVSGRTVTQDVVFTVKVVPPPTLVLTSFRVNHPIQTLGLSINFTAVFQGGKSPYTFTYIGLPPGCKTQNSSSLNCTPTVAGNWTVQVVVIDSSSQSVTGNTTVSIIVLPVSPPANPPANWAIYGIVALGAITTLSLGALWTRKRHAPTRPPGQEER